MRKGFVTAQDLSGIGTVVGGRVDRIGTGVDPVDPLGSVIQRQTVGPGAVRNGIDVDDDPATVSGHTARLDTRIAYQQMFNIQLNSLFLIQDNGYNYYYYYY